MKIFIGKYPHWPNWLIRVVQVVTRNEEWWPEQVKVIKIDKWDTWGMYGTLAEIIHPMLIQLKATKHGVPIVSNFDVPPELANFSDEMEYIEPKWNWVLDQMIWSFGEIVKDEWEMQYFSKDENGKHVVNMDGLKAHDARIKRGFALFGKYYGDLWD